MYLFFLHRVCCALRANANSIPSLIPSDVTKFFSYTKEAESWSIPLIHPSAKVKARHNAIWRTAYSFLFRFFDLVDGGSNRTHGLLSYMSWIYLILGRRLKSNAHALSALQFLAIVSNSIRHKHVNKKVEYIGKHEARCNVTHAKVG